eukprot:TRINITY_DN4489_c0_g1_i1.p1 TRINITY_DN4489_c0_g1~~TRINITY_DN4489_c0_g1_i1.p1  ORF type:complete len:806 (+),score=282.62 TRINITY_DN4489_c0_g1_i1:132-2420(+)
MDIDEIVRKQKEERAKEDALAKQRRMEAAEDRNRKVLEAQKAFEAERLERAKKEREEKAIKRQSEREARNALVLEKRRNIDAETKSKRSRERAIWQVPDDALDHKCRQLKTQVWEKREKLLKERHEKGDTHLNQRKTQLRAERTLRLSLSPRKRQQISQVTASENKIAEEKKVAGRIEISKAAATPPKAGPSYDKKEDDSVSSPPASDDAIGSDIAISPSLRIASIQSETHSSPEESSPLSSRRDQQRPSVLDLFNQQASGENAQTLQSPTSTKEKTKKTVIFSSEVPENTGPRSIERRGRNLTEFPQDILTFSCLRRLSLCSNLICEIPEELSQLEQLEFIDLTNNDLRSLDPCDQAANIEVFHSLKSLRELKLSGNEIHWMPLISTLTSLDLSNNGLTSVPFGIGALPLKYLDLTDNQIGELPGNLFEDLSLTLDILLLDRNEISELPNEIGSLRNMTALSLEGNKICQLPFTFGSCVKLERLNLNFNGLSSLPDSVFGDDTLGHNEESTVGLFKLSELRLNSNQFEEIPEDLFLLSSLKIIDFTSNSISVLPSDFELLFELTELLLSNNSIGNVPESLMTLGCLETLNLSNNQISSLAGAPANLVILDLENNLLQSLPEQLSNLEYLSEFYISGNPLRELPELVFKLTSLTKLYAAEIGAEEVSENIGNLVDLEELDLSQNNISSIPDTFSELTSVQWLSLHHNKLSDIPETMSVLNDLQTLDISGNAFFNLPPVCVGMFNRGVEVVFIDESAHDYDDA